MVTDVGKVEEKHYPHQCQGAHHQNIGEVASPIAHSGLIQGLAGPGKPYRRHNHHKDPQEHKPHPDDLRGVWVRMVVACLVKRLGDVGKKDIKFLHQEAKGHDRDSGPDPGQVSSFICRMIAKIFNHKTLVVS